MYINRHFVVHYIKKDNFHNSLLLRLAPHTRGSASSYNFTDSTSSSSSWASSTGGGGGRVRKMFADRNRLGVDKCVPLDPIEDTNKKPAAKN